MELPVSQPESRTAELSLQAGLPRENDALPEWEGIRIGIAERYLMVALASSAL